MFNQGRIEPENFESEPTRVQKFSSPSRARAPKIFRTIMEKQIIYESMGNEMTKDFWITFYFRNISAKFFL